VASYLITGTARGFGLELVTQLAQLPASDVGIIFATSRSESAAIKSLVQSSPGKVIFVQLDTTGEASIKAAGERSLRLLVTEDSMSLSTIPGLW